MRGVLPFEIVPISAQPFRNQRLRRILVRTMTSPRNTTTENSTNRWRYMKYQHIAKMRVILDFESNMLIGHKIASMSFVLWRSHKRKFIYKAWLYQVYYM